MTPSAVAPAARRPGQSFFLHRRFLSSRRAEIRPVISARGARARRSHGVRRVLRELELGPLRVVRARGHAMDREHVREDALDEERRARRDDEGARRDATFRAASVPRNGVHHANAVVWEPVTPPARIHHHILLLFFLLLRAPPLTASSLPPSLPPSILLAMSSVLRFSAARSSRCTSARAGAARAARSSPP